MIFSYDGLIAHFAFCIAQFSSKPGSVVAGYKNINLF